MTELPRNVLIPSSYIIVAVPMGSNYRGCLLPGEGTVR
jgi:hypothetical protein